MPKVKQLIITGGPSGAGKSFLIEKIRQGDRPDLCQQLGIENPSSWDYLTAKQLKRNHQPYPEKLMVHYSLFDQYSYRDGFRYFHELVSDYDQVTILTLYVVEELLIERIRSRIHLLRSGKPQNIFQGLDTLRRILRLWIKKEMYQRGFSEFLYQRWFDELRQVKKPIKHWLLDSSQAECLLANPYQMTGSEDHAEVQRMLGR